jgi:putative addiction module component (TIGR02574 family)
MNQEAAELLKRALALPAEERADLASTLMDTLDASFDENVEAAWQEEIGRRMEELRSGKVSTIPWDEVREKARILLHDHPPR